MSRGKTAQNRVGQMAFDDMPDVMPVVRSPIPFPDSAVRKRVVLERPAPPPLRKTCPTCGATFDDYTKRWNTIYCRASCRVKMSEIKRDEAIKTLADAIGTTADLVDEIFYADGGLKRLEQMLNEKAYRWDVWVKAWLK